MKRARPHHRPRENFMERPRVTVSSSSRIDGAKHVELVRLLRRVLDKHRQSGQG